ncbi:hypothetical protein F5148DRAFT_431923 [Russula earlei]|uniref:Uncharacterized protein n=1 Tax=Russula earlei TaxID=71964 RepID=A0ACC0U0Q8_9AGAM|nr:hypothetical protein F5148DRAFT_431923 [Russula earlei]
MSHVFTSFLSLRTRSSQKIALAFRFDWKETSTNTISIVFPLWLYMRPNIALTMPDPRMYRRTFGKAWKKTCLTRRSRTFQHGRGSMTWTSNLCFVQLFSVLPHMRLEAGPLYYAALNGFHDIAAPLIANHQDVNATGGYLLSPLGVALTAGHFKMTVALRARCKRRRPGLSGWTPLIAAAAGGDLETFRWLVSHVQIQSSLPLSAGLHYILRLNADFSIT